MINRNKYEIQFKFRCETHQEMLRYVPPSLYTCEDVETFSMDLSMMVGCIDTDYDKQLPNQELPCSFVIDSVRYVLPGVLDAADAVELAILKKYLTEEEYMKVKERLMEG